MLKLINGTLVRRAWQPPEPTVDKKERKDGSRSVLRKRGPKTVQKYLPCLGVFCPGKRDRRQPRSGGAALPPVSEGDAQRGLKKKLLVHRKSCSSL